MDTVCVAMRVSCTRYDIDPDSLILPANLEARILPRNGPRYFPRLLDVLDDLEFPRIATI